MAANRRNWKHIKRWDRVEIIWEDSYQLHGWTAINEAAIDEENSLQHRSVGYWLSETPKQVSICQSSKTDKDFIKEDDTQVNGVFTIPKRAILEIKKI